MAAPAAWRWEAAHPGEPLHLGGAPCIRHPGPERCDGGDNDCDSQIDEDFDLQTDVRKCGACGTRCMAPNAIPGCAMGMCKVLVCEPGHFDLNGRYDDGCEYDCDATGVEVCDGRDNDCDGLIDETGIVAPSMLCRTQGECAGAQPVCRGVGGWVCSYSSTVSLDTWV